MSALVKMSLKLLLRNKGFLFFLIMTPILSTVVLSIKMDYSSYSNDHENRAVLELKAPEERAVYSGDTFACIIKVYDASQSELSEYVLDQMAKSGMFSVCRADVTHLSEEKVDEIAKKDAFDDRAGMLLYLKADFDRAILDGSYEQGVKLYDVSDDERSELFVEELIDVFAKIEKIQSFAGDDVSVILKMLTAAQEQFPEKKRVNFSGKESAELTQTQINHYTQIGYAFAFLTLGFLFCGVCVAHSVIEEQNNKVYTRIMMTKKSAGDYFASKFVIALIICALQTMVLWICLMFVPGMDVGMDMGSFLLIIFLLGLIFSMLSLLLGVVIGDVMSSNYAAFAVWSTSALLAGLYFPLEDTTKALQTLSYLMPQRWFMDISELMIIGDKNAYPMVLCVTVAYLIVILSVGGVGLKLKRFE